MHLQFFKLDFYVRLKFNIEGEAKTQIKSCLNESTLLTPTI